MNSKVTKSANFPKCTLYCEVCVCVNLNEKSIVLYLISKLSTNEHLNKFQ